MPICQDVIVIHSKDLQHDIHRFQIGPKGSFLSSAVFTFYQQHIKWYLMCPLLKSVQMIHCYFSFLTMLKLQLMKQNSGKQISGKWNFIRIWTSRLKKLDFKGKLLNHVTHKSVSTLNVCRNLSVCMCCMCMYVCICAYMFVCICMYMYMYMFMYKTFISKQVIFQFLPNLQRLKVFEGLRSSKTFKVFEDLKLCQGLEETEI